jgi:hypothetical protein
MRQSYAIGAPIVRQPPGAARGLDVSRMSARIDA